MNKIEWEEIYNNFTINSSYGEDTYRAKVPGGWLIKHNIYCNYQYKCDGGINCNIEDGHGHIDEEGFQNVTSNIIFISDITHEWQLEKSHESHKGEMSYDKVIINEI